MQSSSHTHPGGIVRATLTGVCLGSLLSICTVYASLKVGSAAGMSLVAALLGFGFWQAVHAISARRIRPWGILENNISQTAASSAASVASAGLAAAIPAYTLLTGQTLAWPVLTVWLLSVMLIGIVVAVPLRRQLVVNEELAFPVGVASAEMLREIHSRGSEAFLRLLAFGFAALAAGGFKLYVDLNHVAPYVPQFKIAGVAAGALTIVVLPMLLPAGIGILIGVRASWSLLLGAAFAFAWLAPNLVSRGVIDVQKTSVLTWLVWPGSAIMVVTSLVWTAFWWKSIVATIRALVVTDPSKSRNAARSPLARFGLMAAVVGVLAISVVLQAALFDIPWLVGTLAVLLAVCLAMVAARVSGEVGINPIGPIGKVAQLAFGGIAPNSPIPNLMAANVAGGAASQCADLLEDLKCGHLLGAAHRSQIIAQVCGAVAGAATGAIVYTWLIPDPARMLLTQEWPAPAAHVWKSVAELLSGGLSKLPAEAPTAIACASIAALILGVIDRAFPARLRRFAPSAISFGMAFVIPAGISLSIFVGGLYAAILRRWAARWSERFLVSIAVGLVAGESLAEVGLKSVQWLWAQF